MKKTISLLLLLFFIYICLIFFPLNGSLVSASLFKSSILAGLINLMGIALSLCLIYKARNKDVNGFSMYALYGISGKNFSLLILVFIILKFLDIDKYGFIFSFFVFYFIMMLVELSYFLKVSKSRKANKN